MLYPLKFRPIFKPYVWGGRNLGRLFGKPIPASGPAAESWELVDRPDDNSVIANGPLAGKTLRWLMEHHMAEVLGSVASWKGRFPLFVKILDAKEKLSLQVHPPDAVAEKLGGEPKTEMWYIFDALPDSSLYAGLKRGVTRAQFEAALADGTAERCCHRVAVRPGDVMFIPSGRVHAIGSGLVLFEIQQNSDTTYRVFDWGRVGTDGRPRELHVAQALQSIDFDDYEPTLATPQGTLLVDCPLFTTHRERIEHPLTGREDGRTFQILCGLQGSASIRAGGVSESIVPGETVLLPAASGGFSLDPEGAFEFLRVFVRV